MPRIILICMRRRTTARTSRRQRAPEGAAARRARRLRADTRAFEQLAKCARAACAHHAAPGKLATFLRAYLADGGFDVEGPRWVVRHAFEGDFVDDFDEYLPDHDYPITDVMGTL